MAKKDQKQTSKPEKGKKSAAAKHHHGKSLTVREQMQGIKPKDSTKKVKAAKKAKRDDEMEQRSFAGAFFWGFLSPLRWLLKLVGWILWPLWWLLRHIIPPYFKNAAKELKLVTWPTTRQTTSLTIAVLLFAVVFGAIIAGVDFGLDKLFKHFILRS